MASMSARRAARTEGSGRLANAGKVAVASKATFEAARARHPVRLQGLAPVIPLLDQRCAHAEPVASQCRAPIGAHAHLWEAGDLLRQLLRLGPRSALGGQILAQSDVQAFRGRDLAPREDDLERAALPDNARQAHGTPVDQRHAPAPTVDAEISVFGHHPEITPQAHLHAAGNGGTLDGGNDGLVQLEPRRPQRTAGNFAAVAVRARHGDVELTQRIVGVERAYIFEVPAGAEGAARAIEHRDRRLSVGVEFEEGRRPGIGARRVHGVACLGPIVNDGPYLPGLFDSDCHGQSPSAIADPVYSYCYKF